MKHGIGEWRMHGEACYHLPARYILRALSLSIAKAFRGAWMALHRSLDPFLRDARREDSGLV